MSSEDDAAAAMLDVLSRPWGWDVALGFDASTQGPGGELLTATRAVATRQGHRVPFWRLVTSDGTWYAAHTDAMRAARDQWAATATLPLGLCPEPRQELSTTVRVDAGPTSAADDGLLRFDVDHLDEWDATGELGAAFATLLAAGSGDAEAARTLALWAGRGDGDYVGAAGVPSADPTELPGFVTAAITGEVRRAFSHLIGNGSTEVESGYEHWAQVEGPDDSLRWSRIARFEATARPAGRQPQTHVSFMVLHSSEQVAFHRDEDAAVLAAFRWAVHGSQ